MTGAWRRGTLRAGPRAAAAEIVKVGGSLLALRDWPERLAELVAASPAPLLVVGGGRVVDGLREIDAANPRPTPLMHDLAIDAMTLTARIVADALGLPVVALATDGGVLDAAAWLRSSGQAARLPAGWHVTSDSIAGLRGGRLPDEADRDGARGVGRGRASELPVDGAARWAGDGAAPVLARGRV